MRAAFAARRQGACGRRAPAGRATADPLGLPHPAAARHTEEAHGISAKSTDTRQPCARGSRKMGGPAAPRSYAEYKPRTETLRRARLYGCSTRDPLLRKIRRKKPAPPPIPEKPPPPEPVPADLHERLFAYHHQRTEPRPCLLYTSPSPRDRQKSRMPSSA